MMIYKSVILTIHILCIFCILIAHQLQIYGERDGPMMNSRSTTLQNHHNHNHNYQQQQQQQQYQISPPRVNPDLPVIDCKLSQWSPWSTCSAVCGLGRRTRSRYIIQMPQNGGKPCDKKLTRMQRCKDLPPCPLDFNQPPPPVGPKSFVKHNNHQQQQQQKSPHKTRNENTHRTTTTTTTPGSSMMDDEDESKFSRLLKSELGHLQLTSWIPTESYISDGLVASTEMELIGSSSFQIKNGFIYPFDERDRRQLAQ